MPRESLLRKYINKEKVGLEIGPLFWGICRKAEGYNVLIWDVNSKEELLKKFEEESKKKNNIDLYLKADKKIEEIDIVSPKSMKMAISDYLKEKGEPVQNLNGYFDYIISSHNLEHMPNPIQFFIDASEILKEDGILNMAIPIATRCFDCFRPLSTTGEMLDAYISKNKKPSFGVFFDHEFSIASILNEKNERISLNDINYDFEKVIFQEELTYSSYKDKVRDYNNSPYKDSHVWQFNLESFILIFEQLLTCKIINNLEIIDSQLIGMEFIISIRKNTKRDFSISQERRLSLKKESLKSYLSDLNNNYKNIAEENHKITNDLLKVSKDRDSYQKYLNEILNSRIWRYSLFLRKILDKFK